LRFMYEHGTTSSLDILMGARSVEDALNQLDDYNRVSAADAEVLLQVQTAKRRTVKLRRALAVRARALARTTAAAASTVARPELVRSPRAAYAPGLAQQRSLDAARIAKITALAATADAKSQTLAQPPRTPNAAVPASALAVSAPIAAVAPVPTLTTPAGGQTLTVVATGYDLP